MFVTGKNLVDDSEITCPYCNKLNGKNKSILSPKHLTAHKKTLDDVRNEFPNHVTMTQSYYDKQKQNAKGTKEAKCKFHNDDDCCKEPKIVKKSSSKYYLCDNCKKAGKILDKRSSKEAYVKRASGFEKKWGKGITNPRNIPGVIEKAKQTNKERYGGTGFASKELAKKTRDKIEEKYGVDNIMKSDKGKELFARSMQKKYGKNVTSPIHILEVKKKICKTMIENFKINGHPLSGKTYEEIHGNKKANELKQLKRESGAEGYKKCLEMGFQGPSKPQLELFEIVKDIFPFAELEYEQYNYFLDIAIPEHKIAIEYDGSWFHDKDHDDKRDKLLKEFGWDTIRFVDKVPTKQEVINLIRKVIDNR